jgi:hypothetical protein
MGYPSRTQFSLLVLIEWLPFLMFEAISKVGYLTYCPRSADLLFDKLAFGFMKANIEAVALYENTGN